MGRGDSTLIVGPNGTTILVDAGNSGYFSLDGGKIVFEYLESLGISILDYAIVTHRDGDHVGGFAFSSYATSRHSLLMAEREAGGVIKSWAGLSGFDYDGNGFIDFTGDNGCPDPAETPDAAEIGFSLGDGATATIVCSGGWVVGTPILVSGTDSASSLAVNSRSVGIYVQYKGFDYLDKGFDYLVAGDLTGNEPPYMEQAVKDLLVSISDSPIEDPVDVLRINHHGSNSSLDQTYPNAMKPEVAIMSLGDENSYGHPTQDVINRLYAIYPQPLKHFNPQIQKLNNRFRCLAFDHRGHGQSEIKKDIDFIIVGSGPGGATVTKELSHRKKKVCILEWGDNDPLTGSFWYGARALLVPGKSMLFTSQLLGMVRGITTGGSTN